MLGRSEVTEGTDSCYQVDLGHWRGKNGVVYPCLCRLTSNIRPPVRDLATSDWFTVTPSDALKFAPPSKPTPPSHLLQSHSLRSCDLDFAHNSLFARPHIAQILIGSQVFSLHVHPVVFLVLQLHQPYPALQTNHVFLVHRHARQTQVFNVVVGEVAEMAGRRRL